MNTRHNLCTPDDDKVISRKDNQKKLRKAQKLSENSKRNNVKQKHQGKKKGDIALVVSN